MYFPGGKINFSPIEHRKPDFCSFALMFDTRKDWLLIS